MRLRQGDIIESSDPGFAQLEFPGGTIVALGSSSRLFLFSQRPDRALDKAGGPSTAALVLLSGWLKGEAGPNAGAYRYATPLLAAACKEGAVVIHGAQTTEIFVESGSAAIVAVNPGGDLGRSTGAKGGQFFTRRAGKGVNMSPRPDPGFVDSMPRPFRDTLPSRLPRFAGRRPTEPQRGHEVTYLEIQPWLTMAHAWRKGFVERFQPRLNDPEFRKALEAHLNEHPEWDRILHPDKYQPKTAPPAENPEPRPGRN